MSDTNPPSPKPPQSDPPRESRPNSPRRSERPQTANVLLWLVVGLGAVVIAYFFMNDQHKGKLLTVGRVRKRHTRRHLRPHERLRSDDFAGLYPFSGSAQRETQRCQRGGQAGPHRLGSHLPDGGGKRGRADDALQLEGNRLWLRRAAARLVEPAPLDSRHRDPVDHDVLPATDDRDRGGHVVRRSRGRLYAQEDVDITFADAAGIDEAVNELREVVEFLRTPGKYKALGGRIPRGVLLVGPPAREKRSWPRPSRARRAFPFSASRVRTSSRCTSASAPPACATCSIRPASRSPSIIFIDELDALGKVRGSGAPGGHDEREQTLNALLVEMDGFSSDQSVIVMGASNRPETLDPALLRPGRFDRHVLVDRPDIKGREAILKVHAARIKMDDKVDLQWIAKLTPGFVGADLANLVNEAALLAARGNKHCVTMAEFEEGIERVIAGLEKQTRIIHEEEKLRVAYHECGHALVACSLPNTDPVHKISIIPRGMGALGYTMSRPEDDRRLFTQTELQNKICVLLGGITAEEIVFQETSTGAQRDLQQASDIARSMVTEFGMSAKLGRVRYSERVRSPFLGSRRAERFGPQRGDDSRDRPRSAADRRRAAAKRSFEILTGRRPVLEQMSRELLECEVMDAGHLRTIIDQHKTAPQLSPGTFVMHKAKPDEAPHRPPKTAPPRIGRRSLSGSAAGAGRRLRSTGAKSSG